MIRAVPDTNIIISAVFWKGKPYQVILKGVKGDYELVTSPEIIGEVAERLRNKFNFPEDKIQEHLNILMALTHVVRPSTKLDIVRDRNDNKIIECAIDGEANFIA
ncbi:MAG: putative toxin-antitoxin system toxin component, PIN family [Candidatus Aenigmarchaeota archaeon]|nr:putative toxin-antitoxin system toxin component, PIN family [Candidatus Aenigmarchaeota archaeon]